MKKCLNPQKNSRCMEIITFAMEQLLLILKFSLQMNLFHLINQMYFHCRLQRLLHGRRIVMNSLSLTVNTIMAVLWTIQMLIQIWWWQMKMQTFGNKLKTLTLWLKLLTKIELFIYDLTKISCEKYSLYFTATLYINFISSLL